ncbi:uncharacterized protein PITG_15214 [Phytophthora infestans T30-4]|uniref:Transmembrane protein n=1 Tax=Phytophthora infestans (strain T30-4) TaxID=403677 RepID=D0NQ63_PHYIT|nr:uncharacterized protein PITG_15214 [Phytophthora infestans T30-4]EEY62795.1 conserved hypothetical protein [Phytophthora infestans T30-4]|eukprot:XP_002898670.1 conserved hypothetical protein [Phytophthora infestans T30-4]
MWTSVTQEQIDQLAKEAFLPIVLLLNYTLLVYLAMFYWKRRRERRVMLLLFVGTLGTVVTIPFARPEQGFVETVNDISEACCVLTFLLQITIVGYDLNKKFKMRSVMYLTTGHLQRCGKCKFGIHFRLSLLLHWDITRVEEYLENEEVRSGLLRALRHARNAV